MDKASIVFCVAAVLASLAVVWIGFPLAALPRDVVAAASVGVPAEEMPDVELGDGFGSVPAVELLGYYLENPPAAPSQPAAPVRHFGGC